MKTKIFLFTLFLICPSTWAGDSVTSKKIKSLAEELTKNYLPPEKKAELAVLPFNSSLELTKKKVGFAVSEVLTHQIVQTAKFKVLERTQINVILEEQNLQNSGAIDMGTATSIGKILGAKLVILGSVEKLNRIYQVNARLVNVETSEIVSTAFQEIPSTNFDQEAEPYLSLVPSQQTIGLYIAYNFGGKTKALPTISLPGAASVKPKQFELNMVGAGLTYTPIDHWYLDVSYFFPAENHNTGTYSNPLTTYEMHLKSSRMIRPLVGYSAFVNSKIKLRCAIGAIIYNLNASSGGSDKDLKLNETVPLTQLGFEYYMQQRVSLGLRANYSFKAAEGTISNSGGAVGVKLNQFSFEPVVSIYF